MRQFFHQIASLLMALLVLASTVSWTVDKHICMGRVMDISFFAHADDCGMDMDMETSCCDDESFTVQGQDDLKISFENFDLDQQVFLISFVQTYFQRFVGFKQFYVFLQHFLFGFGTKQFIVRLCYS